MVPPPNQGNLHHEKDDGPAADRANLCVACTRAGKSRYACATFPKEDDESEQLVVTARRDCGAVPTVTPGGYRQTTETSRGRQVSVRRPGFSRVGAAERAGSIRVELRQRAEEAQWVSLYTARGRRRYLDAEPLRFSHTSSEAGGATAGASISSTHTRDKSHPGGGASPDGPARSYGEAPTLTLSSVTSASPGHGGQPQDVRRLESRGVRGVCGRGGSHSGGTLGALNGRGPGRRSPSSILSLSDTAGGCPMVDTLRRQPL